MQQAAPESTQDAPDGSTVNHPEGTRPEAAASDAGGLDGQSCQQVTGATDSAPAADLQADLARLWGSSPAPKADPAEAVPQAPTLDGTQRVPGSPAVLPPDPPPLVPLPPGAVGLGTLDKPCKCGSTEFVDVAISEGRTRRDCRKCGHFLGFGKWYDQGGPTP
jgi:hypothetical protein